VTAYYTYIDEENPSSSLMSVFYDCYAYAEEIYFGFSPYYFYSTLNQGQDYSTWPEEVIFF